ncbi:MAG TPA: PspC domain-containing protein [Coriobacteriia bacterium]
MSPQQSDSGRTILAVVGAALVAFGVWALADRTGLIPQWFLRNWADLRGGLGLILLGAVVIWFARGGFKPPAAGKRLYRSRDDKWVAGVLGGLGTYFGIEPIALRLVFIALMALGSGWPIGIYIVMAIIVPVEPVGMAGAVGAATPFVAAPSAPAPPAPAEPPVAPMPPAPAEPPVAPMPAPPVPPEDTP